MIRRIAAIALLIFGSLFVVGGTQAGAVTSRPTPPGTAGNVPIQMNGCYAVMSFNTATGTVYVTVQNYGCVGIGAQALGTSGYNSPFRYKWAAPGARLTPWTTVSAVLPNGSVSWQKLCYGIGFIQPAIGIGHKYVTATPYGKILGPSVL